MAGRRADGSTTGGLAAFALAAVAIACCAGLPILLALAASVGIGTALGIAGGIFAAGVLVVAVAIVAVRWRNAREPPSG